MRLSHLLLASFMTLGSTTAVLAENTADTAQRYSQRVQDKVTKAKNYGQQKLKDADNRLARTGLKKVNLNTANADALRTLRGVGKRRAKRILACREELKGHFNNIEQLIGECHLPPQIIAQNRENLTVGNS